MENSAIKMDFGGGLHPVKPDKSMKLITSVENRPKRGNFKSGNEQTLTLGNQNEPTFVMKNSNDRSLF